MSTHCHIQIEGLEVYLYIHSDGYPSGILPILLPFVRAFWEERDYDPEYFLARCTEAFAKDNPGFIDVGLDSATRDEVADIDYFYFVKKTGEVEVKRVGLGGSMLTLIQIPQDMDIESAIRQTKKAEENAS
jgi:hypothetical protein